MDSLNDFYWIIPTDTEAEHAGGALSCSVSSCGQKPTDFFCDQICDLSAIKHIFNHKAALLEVFAFSLNPLIIVV